MNLEQIEELISMLEDTDISELTIEEEDFSISIKKGSSPVPVSPQQVAQPLAPVQAGSQQPENAADKPAADRKEEDDNKQKIEAPMVGTFYRAPAPDADPFVEVGDVVKEEDTLCIIEAMKLMNEIESEVKGKITDILVEDGESVEYGQPIFIIEKI